MKFKSVIHGAAATKFYIDFLKLFLHVSTKIPDPSPNTMPPLHLDAVKLLRHHEYSAQKYCMSDVKVHLQSVLNIESKNGCYLGISGQTILQSILY